MNLMSVFKIKTYHSRIFLLSSIAIMLVLLIFSSVIYKNMQKTVLELEFQSNKKFMLQFKNMIEYYDSFVRNMCKDMFYNNTDAAFIMHEKDPDISDISVKLTQIQHMVNNSAFLDSIYIYNNNTESYYTTNFGIIQDKNMFDKEISLYGDLPKLKIMPKRIPVYGANKSTLVFSYILYGNLDNNNQMDGGVIFNISTEWLFNNIKIINMVVPNKQEELFIISDKGEIISFNNDFYGHKAEVENIFNLKIQNKQESLRDGTYFEWKINDIDYMTTCIPETKTGLTLIIIQPYAKVFTSITQIRRVIIGITIIFLLIAFAFSLYITHMLYKPIGTLIKRINREKPGELDLVQEKDEIRMLNEVYSKSFMMLKNYEKVKFTYKDALKSYCLKKLLQDSQCFKEKDIEDANNQGLDICIEINKPFIVCVTRIDNYKEFCRINSGQDRMIWKLAIINILTEITTIHFKCDVIDIKDDMIAILINTENAVLENEPDILLRIIKEGQDALMKKLEISVSVSVSDYIESYKDISTYYEDTFNNSFYKCIYGKKSIITSKMVSRQKMDNRFNYPYMIEAEMKNELRSKNIEKTKELLSLIFNEISRLSFMNILLAINYLLNTIKTVVDEMNTARTESININFGQYYFMCQDLETLQELNLKFNELIHEIFEEIKLQGGKKKHDILVETSKEIITGNYTDKGLNLQMLASLLKVNPVYLGRVFKENKNISVAEFINEVRIDKALELMQDSRYSIHEIIEKVGMDNISSFYRIFKQKFGTTPKDFILKKAVKDNVTL